MHRFDNPGSRRRLDTVTLILLMMLTAAAVAAYVTSAWFAANRSVQHYGLAVTSADADLSVEYYYIYHFVPNGKGSSRVGVYTQSPGILPEDTPATEDNRLQMYPYDGIQNQNALTPVVYEIPVSGTGLDVGSQLTLTLTPKADADNPEKIQPWCSQSGGLYDLLSNVVRVRCAVLPRGDYDADQQEPWETAVKTAMGNEQRFVSYGASGYTKKDSLQFQLTVPQGTVEMEKCYIYVVVDYDAELVRRYSNDHKTTGRLGSGNTQTIFRDDLDQFEIQFKETAEES